ncbi:hypothetical protein KC799_06160, partial [candidate division KSB1 bacterium]|nr:hypothetical protein [candidate division KSB1 bacterium]
MEKLPILRILILVEIKSILRSKYLKHNILSNCYAVLIALFFIGDKNYTNEIFLIIWTCIIVAFPVIGISPFFFSKDGTIYQAFLIRNISCNLYVEAKIVFVIMYALVFYAILTPFILQCKGIVIFTYFAGALYYLTFSLIVMTYYSSFDKYKIDHKKSLFFNFSGFSFTKVILAVPIMTPLFFWESTRKYSVGLMILFGILGIMLFKFSINLI